MNHGSYGRDGGMGPSTTLTRPSGTRSHRMIEWNAAQGTFANSPEANRLLLADYQNGWSLDTI